MGEEGSTWYLVGLHLSSGNGVSGLKALAGETEEPPYFIKV